MKFIIKVYQHHNNLLNETLPIVPVKFQPSQITEWLKENLKSDNDCVLVTHQESHILRLLHHIRESCYDLPQLNPQIFEFWFDIPMHESMIHIEADKDGDFCHKIPGGFFTSRFEDLF